MAAFCDSENVALDVGEPKYGRSDIGKVKPCQKFGATHPHGLPILR
jgi:hypothetical protein